MVLQETLRLYPPAYALARTAGEVDVVGGFRVDAGASVTLSPYLTHRHPAFWEQPDHFDPERFRPERSAERHRFAYIPFGAGPPKVFSSWPWLRNATGWRFSRDTPSPSSHSSRCARVSA
jgi:hypothetical protein